MNNLLYENKSACIMLTVASDVIIVLFFVYPRYRGERCNRTHRDGKLNIITFPTHFLCCVSSPVFVLDLQGRRSKGLI